MKSPLADAERDRLIAAMLPDVPFDGWSQHALRVAAERTARAAAVIWDGRRHLVRGRRQFDRFQLLHKAREPRRDLWRRDAVLARRPLAGLHRDRRLCRAPPRRSAPGDRTARALRGRGRASAEPVAVLSPGPLIGSADRARPAQRRGSSRVIWPILRPGRTRLLP